MPVPPPLTPEEEAQIFASLAKWKRPPIDRTMAPTMLLVDLGDNLLDDADALPRTLDDASAPARMAWVDAAAAWVVRADRRVKWHFRTGKRLDAAGCLDRTIKNVLATFREMFA